MIRRALGISIALGASPAAAVGLYGAVGGDTSEVMLGRIGLAVVWVSAPGLEWTDASADREEMARILRHVDGGTAWWVQQAAQYGIPQLEFIRSNRELRAWVEPNPLQHARRDSVPLWAGSALAQIDPACSAKGVLESAECFANRLRRELDAHWAFFIFVLKGRAFADGRNHFVYRHGGPFITMLGPLVGDTSARHEIGHVFYAKDEYWEASSIGCDSRAGYFAVPHLNKETDASLACAGSTPNAACPEDRARPAANACGTRLVRSIMRRSRGTDTREGISPTVMGQIGWLASADGRLLFLDTRPQLAFAGREGDWLVGAAFDQPSPNRQTDSRPSGGLGRWTGLGHDISLNAITDIAVGRVGEPGWAPAVPLDGAADRPMEIFQWRLPDDWRVNPFFQVRLTNEAGWTTIATMELAVLDAGN